MPASCSGPTTALGEPTLVITAGTRWPMITSRSWVRRSLEPCTMRLGNTGPNGVFDCAVALSKAVNHRSSSSGEAQLWVGKDTATLALAAARTNSGLDTPVIGATINGTSRPPAIAANWPLRYLRYGLMPLCTFISRS